MSNSEHVHILGIGATQVGRQPERSFADLVRDALSQAMTDAQLDNLDFLDEVWFSNYMMDFWGQRACRGQEVLTQIADEGLLPRGMAIVNVEAACASGSVAFHEARKHILAGQADVAVAIGVEKMSDPSRPSSDVLEWISAAAGHLNPDAFWQPYRDLAASLGTSFELDSGRSFAMDVYALWGRQHSALYGTTVEQYAAAAAKNHTNAVDNPRAQYRFPMTVAQVLADRPVSDPLTRAMCAPTGDAAAVVILCSDDYLTRQPGAVQQRAVSIRGHALAGGARGVSWDHPRAPARAAHRAYQQARIDPGDLDVVELHDATSIAEILLVEDLGLCAIGEGGDFTESGATARAGQIPVNPSGGLVSRGHPIGATGILMLNEIVLQLRGEAGDIQVPGARLGLAENGGGITGHDVSLCSVTILEIQGQR